MELVFEIRHILANFRMKRVWMSLNVSSPPVQSSMHATLKMIVSVQYVQYWNIAYSWGIWDFWSFAGVAVLVAPHIPLHVGVESRHQFCLQTTPSMARLPLQYTVCVGENVKAVYQESIQQLSMPYRELPSMNVLQYGLNTKSYA